MKRDRKEWKEERGNERARIEGRNNEGMKRDSKEGRKGRRNEE